MEDGWKGNVLDHLLDNVQSKLAHTGATKLLYDPFAMYGIDSRTICFEGRHGQIFQGPGTRYEMMEIHNM